MVVAHAVMGWAASGVIGRAIATMVALAGPPKLPPMPGQNTGPAAEGDAIATTPAKPAPSKPAPSKPATSQPAPSKPTSKLPATTSAASPTATAEPTVAPAPGPGGAAPPSLPDAPGDAATPGADSAGERVEPPQPELSGPPPRPLRDGPGAAPAMSSDERARGRLPGGDDDDDDGRARMPPPLRPPFRGVGLFAAAGVTFGVALAEQIVGHLIVKKRCIEPVAAQATMGDPFDSQTDAEQVGDAVLRCAPTILPVVALRVNSDLALATTIALATAGAVLRGERDAFDHAMGSGAHVRVPRRVQQLRWAGIGVLAAGAAVWVSLSPASWAVLAKCDSARCASRARAMSFSTRDVGAALVAAGAGMVGYAESYRRNHGRYARERAILWAPSFGRGWVGLSFSSRF
ncbi:MAG: hypothetical protein K1X88_02690 [Nannocystaceae bacterium]|nr:hypothetical protein [Nannocystaceae bacterium]